MGNFLFCATIEQSFCLNTGASVLQTFRTTKKGPYSFLITYLVFNVQAKSALPAVYIGYIFRQACFTQKKIQAFLPKCQFIYFLSINKIYTQIVAYTMPFSARI